MTKDFEKGNASQKPLENGESLTEELSPEARYQQWIKQYFDNQLTKIETIPKSEREVEEIGNYGYRMKIKEMPNIPPDSKYTDEPKWEGINRLRTTEYFFDFDDTLFNTTGYNSAIWKRLEGLGMTSKEVADLYESSKVENEKTGQKMYSQDLFIEKLKGMFPEKTAEIESAFAVNPSDFVHQDMAHLLELLTAYQSSRIHILTYGDLKVQQPKVEAALKHYGIPMDILYTQVPKAQFLTQYLPEQYSYVAESSNNAQNFIIIDDSVSELKELNKLSKKIPFLVPIRLRKPEAKKSKEEQQQKDSLYEITNRFAFALAKVANSVKHSRNEGRVTPEEWFTLDITKRMAQLVEHPELEFLNSFETKIRNGQNGTLILSHVSGRDKKTILREKEISFDSSSCEMSEVVHDSDGNITSKIPYRPFYLSAIKDESNLISKATL